MGRSPSRIFQQILQTEPGEEFYNLFIFYWNSNLIVIKLRTCFQVAMTFRGYQADQFLNFFCRMVLVGALASTLD